MTPLERREALARELTCLAGVPPTPSEITDDRVAAVVATGLLTLPTAVTDEVIRHALAAVGLQRGVDRAYYYRLDETAGTIELTHEWHEPSLRPLSGVPKYVQMPMSMLPPSFLGNLKRGGMLRLPSTRQFLGGPVEQLVAPDGDRALALVPVLVDGLLVGVAGFAAAAGTLCGENDLVLLQVVAQGVARAVERGRIDRALAASEARFRATCEASPLGIFLAGPRGECLYVNGAGQRIMGLSAADAMGRGWMSAMHPDDRERIAARWGATVEDRVGYKTPAHRFVHANGDIVFVEVRAMPLAGPLGDRNFLGIIEDVSARVTAEGERLELLARAEAARSEAEVARKEAETARAEVDSILSRVSDAFVAFDLEGRYTYANDRAIAIIGRPREELLGQNAYALFPRMQGGAIQEAFDRAKREQLPVTIEARVPDGRWFDVRVYPSPTGVSVFFEDISDRKRHEEELTADRDYLRQELGGGGFEAEVIGLDPGLRAVMESVARVAPTNTNVLVTGETGTGKELVARAIHEASARRERLLIKVNCAAISAGLVESELFGHEKGAFTGAVQRRKGRFELAHGGTLFLDEVGELPLETQVKLLRVLQEREFERVGGSETVHVDVRVIAATNRNLREMVARGQFREDLYYRLAVFPVALPPLRERTADIPLLARSFLLRFARQAGRPIHDIAPEAMDALCSYRWPGNVRELQNVIERSVVLARGRLLDLDALPDLSAGMPFAVLDEGSTRTPEPVYAIGRAGRTIDELQRGYVAEVLAETSWVIEGERGAARRLGLHPNTLRSRLKRWGLTRPVDVVGRSA
ncbi:MAG TPA: sigma 54-interacting transcriptional regulator [Polyangia bacterium]|nr:sigma 54-interacting transcriptional regulator [Polyangia bacterium]